MRNETVVVITATVRNLDGSVIEFCNNQEDAEVVAAQVRSGDFDGNPRECDVVEEDESYEVEVTE